MAEQTTGRFPFKTKEPANFQCDVIETAGETVRRKRLAKKGNWRRIDLDLGEPTQRALLHTDKEYILDLGRALYAETTLGAGGQFSEFTHELLNSGQHAEFEESGREGNIVRYTARSGEGRSSEAIVHYDETIGLPVKQEFFSLEGGERTLRYSVEVVNFKEVPEADIFSIPSGFKKVSAPELLTTAGK